MRRRDVLTSLSTTALAAMSPGTLAAALTGAVRRRGLFCNSVDGTVAVGLFPEFGAGNFVFDYAHLRAGRLQGEDLLSTFDGSGVSVATVAFTDSGLTLSSRAFRAIPISREAFVAMNDGVRLSAERAWRTDRTLTGTVVLIYGSGPAEKTAFDFWAFHFLSRGWLVVTYDKRGCGSSSGDWRTTGFEALAADAAAVMRALAGAPRPCGLWGASQAGWIMPQLGAQGLTDFIVMHAGAATTPGQQILDAVEAELRAYGMPQTEIDKALAYYALDTDVSRGRKPWSAIDKAYRDALAAGAEWIIAPPAAENAPERIFIKAVADFDPAPYWRQSRAPLLAIFGGKDLIVPEGKNLPLLRQIIRSNIRYHEVSLRRANHLMMIADSGVRAEYARCTEIASGYFPAIDKWLNDIR